MVLPAQDVIFGGIMQRYDRSHIIQWLGFEPSLTFGTVRKGAMMTHNTMHHKYRGVLHSLHCDTASVCFISGFYYHYFGPQLLCIQKGTGSETNRTGCHHFTAMIMVLLCFCINKD
jgi:hypothetical protein